MNFSNLCSKNIQVNFKLFSNFIKKHLLYQNKLILLQLENYNQHLFL